MTTRPRCKPVPSLRDSLEAPAHPALSRWAKLGLSLRDAGANDIELSSTNRGCMSQAKGPLSRAFQTPNT